MTSRIWIAFAAGVLVGAAALPLAGAPTVEAQGGGGRGAAGYQVRIVLENDLVRVRDVVFPPGVRDTGRHTHEYAHVGVILTPGSLLFTDPDGKTEVVEYQTGTVGFREAKATHAVGNPGKEPMRVIEVEVKR